MDREAVIQLSVSIEQARKQVSETEELLQKRKAKLQELLHALDTQLDAKAVQQIVVDHAPTRFYVMSSDNFHNESDKRPLVAAMRLQQTIVSRARLLFEAHPSDNFDATKIIERLGLQPIQKNEAAVRQALKRLSDEGYLLRKHEGIYARNLTSTPKPGPALK